MNAMQLTDVYEIRPGQDVVDMTAEQKHQLLDAAVSMRDGKKKGLVITFDLSSSFRRTNGRLYTAKGQQAGLKSWTHPYPKPILKNHDRKSDPIGRIISVEWVSNDQEAMQFFDNTNDFMQFKRVLDGGDPQKIYKEMYKRNLLTDDAWPGMGKLVARARISDQEAIEKFLDGRYLTFSAGTHTDAYLCGLDGSDWAAGDICEHAPGSITDDGMPVIHITGIFAGDEASVVTMPGNNLSQLTSMKLDDSVELAPEYQDALKIDRTHIQFTDASVDTGDIMATPDTPEVQAPTLDATELVKQLLANADALAALKAALADKEVEDAGDQTGEVEGGVQVSDSEEEVNDDQESAQETQEEGQEVASQEDATEQTSEDTDTDVSDIDWYLLGAALDRELGDAKLDAEALAKLEDSSFLGPERSFPVADEAHAEAARALIARTKLSDDQKQRVLASVDRVAELLSTEDSSAECGCKDLQARYDTLSTDYQSSLELATRLQTEVDSLKEKLSTLDTSSTEVQNEDSKTPLKVGDIKEVEDESASSSQALAGTTKTLGDYEKKIVSRFQELRDEKGAVAAARFLANKIARGHLPRTFDITPHIQENE